MLRVAITGNIASGKSTVEKILTQKGFSVLDTDKVTHKLLNCDEVFDAFKGFDVVENGQISRQKLGQIVFNNNDLLKKLEQILHPKIQTEIENFFKEHKSEKVVFVSIPQLFEANMENLFDKIILITADDNIRLQRLVDRNGFDKDYAQKRINAQIPQEEKIKKSDTIINNNGTLDEIEKQLRIHPFIHTNKSV